MDRRSRKAAAAVCGAFITASVCGTAADIYSIKAEAVSVSDTGDMNVIIYANGEKNPVSPYIFGINDKGDISGVSASVLKQCGDQLSSYNWETNYSNTLSDGVSTNGISLVENFSDSKWDTPALYTDSLISDAFVNSIPVKLVTLQMMGYVANDAMGVVSDDEDGSSDRWAEISFNKNDSYLNIPNTSDGVVYIDEYAGYLINKYGTVSEGGINGYFLDSEPEKWDSRYPTLNLGTLDPDELISRSARLSEAVKIIDGNALIFGPSVGGAKECIDLNGTFYNDVTFADYYLSGMKEKSEAAGKRLLDVFDVHFYTEACGRNGDPVLTSSSADANIYRMQAPRILWDSDYSENSNALAEYGEYLPLLKSINSSIDRCYPNTKLSVSEYSFGGGDNISGTIAEIDALGAFAENGVYLACLMPDEISEYQKTGINIFTDYDGNGAHTGDQILKNSLNDYMSACYAMTDSSDESKLWVILTNKNSTRDKSFSLDIRSDINYDSAEIYRVNGGSSEIVRSEEEDILSENAVNVTLEPMSVCLIELTGDASEIKETEENDSEATAVSETDADIPSESTELDPVEETIEIITETTTVTEESEDMTDSEAIGDESTDSREAAVTSVPDEAAEEESVSDEPESGDDRSDRTVPSSVKIVIIVLITGCAGAVIYILLFDR